MGPTGAYLYFVLYVIPYPQHHDPENSLSQRAGYTQGKMKGNKDS